MLFRSGRLLRLEVLRQRLHARIRHLHHAEVPAALASARRLLGPMPRVHLETAIAQFSGTITLVTKVIDTALRDAPGQEGDIARVRPAALEALSRHRSWLSARLDEAAASYGFADPRIGAARFARKLSLTLNTQADADGILARAHADLDRVSEEIASLAAGIAGIAGASSPSVRGSEPGPAPADGDRMVREVLDRLAADAPDDQIGRAHV